MPANVEAAVSPFNLSYRIKEGWPLLGPTGEQLGKVTRVRWDGQTWVKFELIDNCPVQVEKLGPESFAVLLDAIQVM